MRLKTCWASIGLLFLYCAVLSADTIGNTTILPTPTTFSPIFVVSDGPFMAMTSGTLTNIWYACGNAASTNLTVGVYADNPNNLGHPGSLVKGSVGNSGAAVCDNVFHNIPVTGSIVAGTAYHIAEASASGLNAFYMACTCGDIGANTYSSGVLPNPFPSPSNLGGHWSIYAEYTASDGGGAGGGPTGGGGNTNVFVRLRRR